MRNFFLIVFVAGLSVTAYSQSLLPPASPSQSISQKFAGMAVDIKYYRPSLKGRAVFEKKSELAQQGIIWRLGANYATTIRFTEPVQIGGSKVDSGTYALYAIPGTSSWEMILNKGVKNWGAYGYKKEDDVLRFNAPVKKLADQVETFTIQFADIKNESVAVQMSWGKMMASFPIVHEIKSKVKADIYTALAEGKDVYEDAATYYYDYEHKPDSALHYLNKTDEKQRGFPWYLMRAKVLNDMGRKKEAIADAEECIRQLSKFPDDAYIIAAEKVIAEAKG